MKDEFASIRLPDPPTAGYATTRQKAASDWMIDIVRKLEREPPQGLGRDALLLIVCGGKSLWREIARKTMRGMLKGPHLDEAVDALWQYFELMAGPDPMKQLQEHTLVSKWAPWLKATYVQYQGGETCPQCQKSWETVPCGATHRAVQDMRRKVS